MEAVRNLKVNMKLAGTPCRSCSAPLALAEAAAVCAECQGTHHGRCWEARRGCATPDCINAPLARLDGPGTPSVAWAPALAAGWMRCRRCDAAVPSDAHVCEVCGAITSPDGIYRGPKTNAPGAVASMIWGIVGLLFCGVILGGVAISKASAAKREISINPTYGGGGYATAGMVLGIIDIVAFVLIIIVRAGGS